MNTFDQLTPTHRRRTRRLVAAAACAAAVAAPVVGLNASAGDPPARPVMRPTVTPMPARTHALPASGILALPRVATIDVDLCATSGTVALPRSSGSPTAAVDTVQIWGYVAGDCTTGTGTAVLGGAPTITAMTGDTVNVTLHNGLTVPTSLAFGSQTLPTDTVGAAAYDGLTYQTATYSFVVDHPGAFLYHAGFAGDMAIQTAMGLYGVLDVAPTTPGQAYDSADTAFDVAAPVVIGEIDPALNANPATFDVRNFAAKWTTMNGKVFPDSANLATVAAGDTLLLRYLNAGVDYHSMSLLGGNQRIIAEDGNERANPYSVVAQTVGPGQSFDALVEISPAAAANTQLSVFEGSLQMRNRGRRPTAAGTFRTYGGALGFIDVGGIAAPGDTTGPVTSGVAVDTGTGVITATVSDATKGGSSVLGAEYSIDTIAAAGAGTPLTAVDGNFDAVTEAVTATAALPSGQHTIYVRGQDAAGNWGQATAKSILIDATGPTVSGPTLTPNPSTGAVAVAVHATASDVNTGNADIIAAEFTVDGGTPAPMTVNQPLTTASIDGTIPAGLAPGDHVVAIRAQDSAGNWGAPVTTTLTVTTAGPITTGLLVAPNPTNGVVGVNSTTAAVRVTASANKPGGVVNRAEGFIDTVGANGAGFPFVPADGRWNSATESISVDIPLATIRALSDGMHTISVHARDSVGNWGAVVSIAVMVDKTAPTASAVTVTTGSNTATVQATAVDVTAGGVQSGVGRVEFYVDTDPGLGAGTPMALVSGSTYSAAVPVAVLSEGTHTVVVRSRDLAGTWSTNAQTTFTVVRSLYFSTVGNTNPPGLGGTADDADVFGWAGSSFTRYIDTSAITNPLPAGANVDGLKVDTAAHFWVSFATDTTIALPGPDLTVQDEDIAEYNAGAWSVFFDGTALGLTSGNLDIDAFDIVGTDVYISTAGNATPPGAGGSADDADVYRWTGVAFSRVFDASASGLAGNANVDGLSYVDATHLYVSFSGDTTVTGPGAVQDEDIVYRNGTTWSVWFDGTAKNLTNNNHDLDAIDVV